MGMHVLVTGAGGFSGAQTVRALLARGHEVTAAVSPTSERLLHNVGQHGEPRIIAGDLAGDMELPRRLDAVVHVAGRSPGPAVTVDDFVRDNVVATARLVSHAKRSGVRRFLFFSSLSVYGRIADRVVEEAP